MQIRPTGKLTEISKDTRNNLAKFEDKIVQSKDTVNLYAQNFSKILAKLHIQDHILPFFSLTLNLDKGGTSTQQLGFFRLSHFNAAIFLADNSYNCLNSSCASLVKKKKK